MVDYSCTGLFYLVPTRPENLFVLHSISEDYDSTLQFDLCLRCQASLIEGLSGAKSKRIINLASSDLAQGVIRV